jgi:hypothetical protein
VLARHGALGPLIAQAGEVLTVNAATEEVWAAQEAAPLTMTSQLEPLSPVVRLLKINVALVAPPIEPPLLTPELFLRHWYVSPLPVAATVNEAVPGVVHTVCDVGWLVMETAWLTVSTAAEDVWLEHPAAPLTTTDQLEPLSLVARLLRFSVALVAPLIVPLSLTPELFLRHWYVSPLPVAVTLNEAVPDVVHAACAVGWPVIETAWLTVRVLWPDVACAPPQPVTMM